MGKYTIDGKWKYNVNRNRLKLEPLELYCRQSLSKSFLVNPELIIDEVIDRIIFTMRQELIYTISNADTKAIVFETKNPSSWWQHLKRDHFPKWFVKKFPIQYVTITHNYTVEVKQILPEAPIFENSFPYMMLTEIDSMSNISDIELKSIIKVKTNN